MSDEQTTTDNASVNIKETYSACVEVRYGDHVSGGTVSAQAETRTEALALVLADLHERAQRCRARLTAFEAAARNVEAALSLEAQR
jgi:hypothetical protein